MLIISGLGGEEYYSELFARWSLTLLEIAHQRYGLDDGNTLYLAETTDTAPERIDGISGREAVVNAIAELAARSAAGDRVVIVLIGHGTAQGAEARFNLPGPDLTPADLAGALTALEGRRVALINTAPASGAFLPALTAEGRVVITATADGAENQHTRFAGFFIDALADTAADADKDTVISLLEAFRFAQHQVQAAYQTEQRLVTEHARLDDGADGRLAQRFDLAGQGDGQLAPAYLALRLEARGLVDRIERLKREKQQLLPDDYERRLEALLVELALNRRALRTEMMR